MTESEKIDRRIDRCIARRKVVEDQITFLLKKLRERNLYLAELGRMKSKLATNQFELQEDTTPKMKSKDKLLKYEAALVKFFRDRERATKESTPPPIHFPTRSDFEVRDPAEIFVAERIEKKNIPADYKKPEHANY